MNLTKYVKKFGNRSFLSFPFSMVDACLFATIIYSYLDQIAPSFKEKDKYIYIKDITDENLDAICTSGLYDRENKKALKLMRNSLRYKDIKCMFAYSVYETEFLEQACALTFLIPDVGYLIAFRGTDKTAIGWKENLTMSSYDATASQIDAVEYLNIVYNIIGNQPLMLCGHSKGGNLAFFSSLYCEPKVYHNITKVFSFDGPGMRSQKFLNLESYKYLKDRLILVAPRDSVVSAIFYNPPVRAIVKSHLFSMAQHDEYFWKINKNGQFKEVNKFAKFVPIRSKAFFSLSKSMTREETNVFIDIVINSLRDENGEMRFVKGGLPSRKINKYLKKRCTEEQKSIFKSAVRTIFSIYKEELKTKSKKQESID